MFRSLSPATTESAVQDAYVKVAEYADDVHSYNLIRRKTLKADFAKCYSRQHLFPFTIAANLASLKELYRNFPL